MPTHLQAKLARDQRLEAAGHAVALGARAPPQFEHVAEPHRGDQAAGYTLALENGVGADSGAVHEGGERVGAEAAFPDAGHHAARLVVRR